MNNKPHKQLRIFMVDSIGAHRGMHYYNFPYVSALNLRGMDTLLITTEETLDHELQPPNIEVLAGFRKIYGDETKWLRGFRYIQSLLRIAFWAFRLQPDIVHFHFFQLPFFDKLLIYFLHLFRVKIVITVHDVLPFSSGMVKSNEDGGQYQKIYKLADSLIVHSQYALESLAQLGTDLVQKANMIPHGNFVDLSSKFRKPKLATKVDLEIDVEHPLILIFGTIKTNKRLDWAIKAMFIICQTFPAAQLMIAGKPRGQDISPLKDLIADLELTDNIIWCLEFIPDDDLYTYISAADVVLFPYEWIYQSGALLLAMSFAKPVIATAVGNNVETIDHEKTGFLVPPDEPEAIAYYIQKIISDKAYAEELGQAAYEYVATELSWERIAQLTVSAYSKTLP